MATIKKGDTVLVIAGKFKGYKGEIENVIHEKNRVVVSGVNLKKKHMKSRGEIEGGIIDIPASIHRSNVALIDPKTKKPTRIGYEGTGKDKVRIAKKSGAKI